MEEWIINNPWIVFPGWFVITFILGMVNQLMINNWVDRREARRYNKLFGPNGEG